MSWHRHAVLRKLAWVLGLFCLVGSLDMAIGILKRRFETGTIIVVKTYPDGAKLLQVQVSSTHVGRMVDWYTERGLGYTDEALDRGSPGSIDIQGRAYIMVKPTGEKSFSAGSETVCCQILPGKIRPWGDGNTSGYLFRVYYYGLRFTKPTH